MFFLARILSMFRFSASWMVAITAWLGERQWGKWLLFYLASALPYIVDKVVSFFGVKFVSDNFLLPELMPLVTDSLLALPDDWKIYLGLARVDQAISILISALVIRVAYSIRVQRVPGDAGWKPTP